MQKVGEILEVWRYPVKSMGGERAGTGLLTRTGLEGDRAFAVRDLRTGRVVSAKVERRILACGARLAAGELTVELPDGRLLAGEAGAGAGLSAWLGRPVRVERARAGAGAVYEILADPEDETSALDLMRCPDGSFHDTAPVHLLTTASLRAMAERHPTSDWDFRRFRPTLLVEAAGRGFAEDAWKGHTLAVGGARMLAVAPAVRCGVPGRAQAGLGADPSIVRAVRLHRDLLLGLYAEVTSPGTVAAGDPVWLLP